MAGHDQAEKLTGLKVGGISALALLNRPFDVYIDESAASFEQIAISGGQRGVNLQLRVDNLLGLTGAQGRSGQAKDRITLDLAGYSYKKLPVQEWPCESILLKRYPRR